MTDQQLLDIDRILDEDHWPHYPQLPMKRGPGNEELGVLVRIPGISGNSWTIYLTNMFDPITRDTRRQTYPSPEQVVLDGWKVD